MSPQSLRRAVLSAWSALSPHLLLIQLSVKVLNMWDHMDLESFCRAEEPSTKCKENLQNGRMYLQSTSDEGLAPKHVRSFYSSVLKTTNNPT